MKRLFALAIAAGLILSLAGCGGVLVDYDTPKSEELSTQYDFYSDSQRELSSGMAITPEQADEVFLILVSCGMDGKVSSVTRKAGDEGHCTVSALGSLGAFDVYYTDGVVSRVERSGKELYPNPEPDEAPTVEPVSPTDWEIITREGHPTYYGSVEDSLSVWGDVEKGKVYFAGSLDKIEENAILSMSAYRNSDIIRGIGVSFSSFEEPPTLTVEEVLPVIASYMPYEVMDEYYRFMRSELITPDDEESNETRYFIISYNLTDEAKESYYSENHGYSGTIDVQIYADKTGCVGGFSIGFGLPRWMASMTTNSYHMEEWACDLYDYRP